MKSPFYHLLNFNKTYIVHQIKVLETVKVNNNWPLNCLRKILASLSPTQEFNFFTQYFRTEKSKQAKTNISELQAVKNRDIVTLENHPSMEKTASTYVNKSTHSEQFSNTVHECDSVGKEQTTTAKTTLMLSSENPRLRHRYDDSLEKSVYEPSKKYHGAKMIDIKDSLKLMEEHRKNQEVKKCFIPLF